MLLHLQTTFGLGEVSWRLLGDADWPRCGSLTDFEKGRQEDRYNTILSLQHPLSLANNYRILFKYTIIAHLLLYHHRHHSLAAESIVAPPCSTSARVAFDSPLLLPSRCLPRLACFLSSQQQQHRGLDTKARPPTPISHSIPHQTRDDASNTATPRYHGLHRQRRACAVTTRPRARRRPCRQQAKARTQRALRRPCRAPVANPIRHSGHCPRVRAAKEHTLIDCIG